MVRHAVKQVDDPVRIQIEGRHLLPEPLGAALVGSNKLGLRQLTGEPEGQLTLLLFSKARGGPPATTGRAAWRADRRRPCRPGFCALFHRVCSGDA
jgi:hypothetical protein